LALEQQELLVGKLFQCDVLKQQQVDVGDVFLRYLREAIRNLRYDPPTMHYFAFEDDAGFE
jgi:hypothetical protein